ncbi:MAG: sigma-70 family RNA polymerase sigma factor [Firmicutes bacterium]|nr:sigma-70 family RNA polymerase sigma factor [[Eubacterium] siraeum]MCM1487208.1 sigma-70 family RNA polymerase sigma factor [Bacillota bacterium]
MSDTEDFEIIDKLIARDESAVAGIKEKYGGLCKSVAHGMLRSPEDAEECINDVYAALWSHVPAETDNLKAYICRVTKNICLKKIEYNSAKKRNENFKVSLSEIGENFSCEAMEADEENRELGEIISRFLRSQTPEVRNVFLRRYWLTEPVKEIAARFSFSESKVKSMLFHTRNKLKKFLKKEGIDL